MSVLCNDEYIFGSRRTEVFGPLFNWKGGCGVIETVEFLIWKMRSDEVVNAGLESMGMHSDPTYGCEDGGEKFKLESQVTGYRDGVGARSESLQE